MNNETGWYEIELPDDLRKQDAIFSIRHEFLQQYSIVQKNPKTALLLANWDTDNPEHVPPVLYYYLSPAGARINQHLLYPNARDCPKPSPDKRYFVAGDSVYFLEMQASDKDKRES